MSKNELKMEVRKWDSKKWEEGMESKVSLRIYRNLKKEIKEETCYDNTYSSVILFRLRTNTLQLNITNRHNNNNNNNNVNCVFCEDQEETRFHFLLFSQAYTEERQKIFMLQQPYEEDLDKVIGKVLFEEEEIEKTKSVLFEMWMKRIKKVKESTP